MQLTARVRGARSDAIDVSVVGRPDADQIPDCVRITERDVEAAGRATTARRSLAALVLDPGASVEVALVESLLVDDVTSALVLTVVAPLGTESSDHPAAKAPRTKKMPGLTRCRKDREQGSGDLCRSFLVGEQAGARDDLEPGVGERTDHLLGPIHRKERVLITPDQLHRDVDSPMDLGEIVHVLAVEASQQPHGSIAVRGRRIQRTQEELLELAVEQR